MVLENARVILKPVEAGANINEDSETKKVRRKAIALLCCLLTVVAIAIGVPLGLKDPPSPTVYVIDELSPTFAPSVPPTGQQRDSDLEAEVLVLLKPWLDDYSPTLMDDDSPEFKALQ